MRRNSVYILFISSFFRIVVNGEILFDFDRSIRPTDDFYTYANGQWLNRTVIPPSLTSWGGSFTISHETLLQLKNIFDDLTRNGTSESSHRKLGDLYLAALDEQMIEKISIQPLKETFLQLKNVKTYEELIMFILHWYKKSNQGLLFRFDVYPDPKNSSVNIAAWRVNHISFEVNSIIFFAFFHLATWN